MSFLFKKLTELKLSFLFIQIILFRSIVANHNRVKEARKLWHHIRANLNLTEDLLAKISQLRILEQVEGLSTYLQIFNLSCILGETYLWDDVLNTGLEIICLRYQHLKGSIDSNTLMHTPSFVLLPTTLLTDLKYVLDSTGKANNFDLYSTSMKASFNAIQSDDAGYDGCILVVAEYSHFTAYKWRKASPHIEYCDTLLQPPSSDTRKLIGSFLEGDDRAWSDLSKFSNTAPSRQPSGSGSCGVAVLNWIEKELDLTTDLWTPNRSAEFRDKLLISILMWHICAKDYARVNVSQSINLKKEETYKPIH